MKAMKWVMAASAAALVATSVSGALAKVEGDTIILGSAISLTGNYATNGLHTQRGYDYAVRTINAAGGVKVGGKSYKLAIKYYDDESTPARAAQLVERLIAQDGVQFMLGPYGSGLTKAVLPVSEKYGVPMIEAEGASRSLFTQGYKYAFAVLSTSEQYLSNAIDLAAELNPGKKLKVAMAFENDPFSLDVREGVMDRIKANGFQVMVDDKLPADLSDMSATLTKVKALRPDILIVSGHSKGAATAGRQIEEQKISVPMIALTHCEAAKLPEKFPKAASGMLCPTQWLENIPKGDAIFGTAAEYNEKVLAEYSEFYKVLPYQLVQASAAVLVWKDALERANSFDNVKVRDAIAATQMETFYGDIKFSENGNNIAKPMFMRQIGADGNYNNIISASDIVFPRKVSY